jgi:PmbA protein
MQPMPTHTPLSPAFSPRSLPAGDALPYLIEISHKYGAMAADILLVNSTDIALSQRLGVPEGIERSENTAVGLRVFVDQGGTIGQAIVSSTDLSTDTLSELAERAVAMARIAPPDPASTLADPSLLAANPPELDLLDADEPSSAWLREQCSIAEDTARATPGITNSEGADASYSRHRVQLGIARDGVANFLHSYDSSYFGLSVSVLAGTGTGMERDYAFTSARHRSDLDGAKNIGTEAAERALKRMNPRKVASCTVPVIFDPRVSKSIVSILASAISGSAVARKATFLKDALGTSVFNDTIHILDDPHRLRGIASKPFDGEGVQNTRRAFVEGGVLQSWLLDVRSANLLGMTTTGNASRGIGSPPSPSASNIYMQAGSVTPAALIGDIRSGLYLTETFGMGINIITGDYSQGAAGFWIENGELAYPVSEITIAGNLRDMFAELTPANDLQFRYGTNAPTLRIERMTIAGT